MTPGRKDDTGKNRYSLIPWLAMPYVVRVLDHGSGKYGDDNWKRVENPKQRYFDAAMRHLTAWWNGDATDAESGLPHLAHATVCLLFLLHFEVTK